MKNNRFINIVFLLIIIALIVVIVMPGKEDFKNENNIPNFEELQKNVLQDKGDAWGRRSEIVKILEKFQKAYSLRDTSRIDDFMEELFVNDNQILILGTEPGQWFAGYEKSRNLILQDWKNWGTLSMMTNDAYIVVKGDIAWFATVGRVGWPNHNLPIRISGILVSTNNVWQFSKLQFQWDITVNKI